jgi:hypothetical protein
LRTSLSYLFSVEPPWIYIGVGEAARVNWFPAFFYSRANITTCVRRLRGNKMRTTPALMDEFAAAWQFFEGFGNNWYALRECLEYVDEWLPAAAYILVIEKAEEVLADEEPDQTVALLKTLSEIGDWWANPIEGNDRFNRGSVPFHTLLHLSSNSGGTTGRLLSAAQISNIPIRTDTV